MKSPYRMLIWIGVLLIAVVYLVIPGAPVITIGDIKIGGPVKEGLDLKGGMRVILAADLPETTAVTAQQMNDTLKILQSRSNALGVSEVNFQLSGSRRILGELPGVTNTEDVIKAIKTVGKLAFVPAGTTNIQEGDKIQIDYSQPWAEGYVPVSTPAATPTPDASGVTPTVAPAPVVYRALMTGASVNTVGVTSDTLGKVVIDFTLNADYTKVFGDFTSKHINEILAISLDGIVISAPKVNSAITEGKGIIEGSFTVQTANELAIQLRYGSLPVPIKVEESRAVGATLGEDSVNKSIIAGVIGLSMVIVLMLVMYRIPGLLAVLALLIYGLTNFALFKLIPGYALTLPGIAGFVLSIGMAVDANILIFERLKEELRAGRSLQSAIDLAWRRAWPSIRDSNIATIITCIILFIFGNFFGASLVKGFSLNLLIGVLVSLFTAIVVTRTFLHVVLDNLKFVEHPRWFGA
jgi:preprotein translocase subunit SecD